MLSAIADFLTPSNITGIRSWFGLINQVAYAFSQSKFMAPFRELLKGRSNPFYWDDNLDKLFNKSKLNIKSMVKEGVTHFDPSHPVSLSTDWSKTRVGFVLRQKYCSCKPIDNPDCGPEAIRSSSSPAHDS